MAASMSRPCFRSFSKFSLLNARPGYPPSIRYREVILPRVPRIVEENTAQYPPIKPSITSRSKAGKQALRESWIENIRNSDTPNEMITLLNKRQRWQSMIYPQIFQSDISNFSKHITKTVVIDELPENIELLMKSDHLQTESESLTERFKELLITESFSIQRQKTSQDQERRTEAKSLAQNMVNVLVSYLGHKYSHLNNAVVDAQCPLKSFWERGERRVQFSGEPVSSIRTESPLMPFTSANDKVCQQGVEDWPYDPKDLGVFERHINSICFPGFKYQPDHLHPHTQVYSINFNKKLAENNGVYQDIQDNFGLMTGYAWINALAMFQHHCWYKDIPKPMAAQIILTDGRTLSFYCYQANTLNLLEDKSPLNNVCFQRTMVPLYTDVRDGVVRDFNGDALKLLLAFFVNPTVNKDM